MPTIQGKIHLGFDNTIRDGWVSLEEAETTLLAQTGVLDGGLVDPLTDPNTHELVRANLAISYDKATTDIAAVKSALEAVSGVVKNGRPSDTKPIPNPLQVYDLKGTGPDGIVLTGWPAFPAGAQMFMRVCGQASQLSVCQGPLALLGTLTKDSAAETYSDGSLNTKLGSPGSALGIELVFFGFTGGDYVIPANSIRLNDDTASPIVDLVHGTLTLDPSASPSGAAFIWISNEKKCFFSAQSNGSAGGFLKNVPIGGVNDYSGSVGDATREWVTL